MNDNNREDMLLNTLYRKRKQHMRASEKEKRDFTNNLVKVTRKQHQPRWFLRFQFALSIVAVSVLGFYMFGETRSSSAMHITHIDETEYYQVAVIERQSNGLNWSVTNKKQQLDKKRDNQLANLTPRFDDAFNGVNEAQQVTVKVLNKSEDWHLETCDGQTHIKIQQDLVAELMHSQDLFENTAKGQWLALHLDKSGAPKLLYQHNAINLCG